MGTTEENSQNESSELASLLDTYEEIMDGREQTVKPYEVTDELPPKATYDHNNLYVRVGRTGREKSKLTPKRRKILNCIANGMDPQDIQEQGIASNAHTSRTRNEFGFLLNNPLLYEAFVERPTKMKANYELTAIDSEGEELSLTKGNKKSASAAAERLISNGWSKVRLEYPDGNVETYGKKTLEPASEPDSTSSQSQQDVDSDRPIDGDDYKSIVAALYRDEQNELASKVIDTVWGGQ